MKMALRWVVWAGLLLSFSTFAGPSVYQQAPNDARAITVVAANDGKQDASAAIQAALDSAEAKGAGGIVLLPAGRYRLTKTLYLWPGVRLIGVGASRPVLLLADNTPGFQQGVKHMVIFTGRGPEAKSKVPFPPAGSVPFRDDIADANSGTFYSAIDNIDIEIGKGNAAAAAIRFHAAQHAFLRHMEFQLGSAFAGIYQAGNYVEDLHFHGGRYGVVSEKTSDAWQFALIDSSFDGQRDAAIREHEASLTLINVAISNTKTGIDIDQGYGDWLWGKNVRFDHVTRAGVVISNENNVYTQIGFDHALASNTPTFALMRDSGRKLEPAGRNYRVDEFTYGLTLPQFGALGDYTTRLRSTPLGTVPPLPTAMRALPAMKEWTNVRDLGAKGDGTTDDTAVLQQAIAQHRVLYFPSGFYRIADTLTLKPDTVLIGLHPLTTQLVLADETPGFAGVGAPKAMLETPRDGGNIVAGIGLFAGGINARATNVLWQAGENSLLTDVKIMGGHGTQLADASRFNPYDAQHAGDPDPRRRWDGQYPSIMVANGGGGTFTDIWTANTYAQAGFSVSDTATPGHVYLVSNEHHVRTEFALNRAANWEFLAPQTEEETGESQDALSFDIRNSHDLLLTNYHGYRVTRSVKPAATAVRLENSHDIRLRNVHVNAESGLATCDANGCGTYLRASKYPFENAVVDVTHKLEVREREFAALDIGSDVRAPLPTSERTVTKLAGDFFSIAGAAADAQGKLYFIDRKFQRIYGWDAKQGLTIERDAPLDAINLAVAANGDVLVLSSQGPEGTVYWFQPGSPSTELNVIPPTAAVPHANATTLLPGNWWNNAEFKDQYDAASDRFTTLAELFAQEVAKPKPREYVSPDGSLVLPAFRTFQQGPPNHLGWRWSDALQSYGFVGGKSGQRVLVSNESEAKIYSAMVGESGALTQLKPLFNRGGESVAVDGEGNVYVANGQIFVLDPTGKQLGVIEVPERPLQLVVGGDDSHTLFVLTHHSLYALKL